MRRHLRGALRLAVAVSAAIAVVAQQSEVASAATALSSGQWVLNTDAPSGLTDYTASTTGPYWSAVIFFGNSNIMHMLDGSGNQLAATTYPSNLDYVAIDGNIRGPQTYTARVVNDFAGTQYQMLFLDGNTVLPSGTTYIPAAANQANDALIRDVYLTAGTSVQIVVAQTGVTCPAGVGGLYMHAFLLASDPSTPSTGVQIRESALASAGFDLVQTTYGCAIKLHANVYRTAWYGLLIYDRFSPQHTIILNASSLVV